MSITVEFQCSVCCAKAEGTTYIKKAFERVSANFSRRLPWNVEEVAPPGWIASDPYTAVCYCPKCWSQIEEAGK